MCQTNHLSLTCGYTTYEGYTFYILPILKKKLGHALHFFFCQDLLFGFGEMLHLKVKQQERPFVV